MTETYQDRHDRLDRELVVAIIEGHVDKANDLIEEGANPRRNDFSGEDKYQIAIALKPLPESQLGMLEVLLNEGKGFNPASLAVHLPGESRGEMLKMLNHRQADLNEKAVLLPLVERGAVDEVAWLLNDNPHFTRGDVVHHAVKSNQPAVAELLVRGGSDLLRKDEQGRIPLDYVPTAPEAQEVWAFLGEATQQHQAEYDALVAEYQPPLSRELNDAILAGDVAGVQVLIAKGADVNTKFFPDESVKRMYQDDDNFQMAFADEYKRSPYPIELALASPKEQRLEMLTVLLQSGAKTEQLNLVNPMVAEGAEAEVALLLKHGASPDWIYTRAETVREEAWDYPDWPKQSTRSPLLTARGLDPEKRQSMMEVLLRGEANPNKSAKGEPLPLEAAVKAEDIQDIKLLLKHGANPMVERWISVPNEFDTGVVQQSVGRPIDHAERSFRDQAIGKYDSEGRREDPSPGTQVGKGGIADVVGLLATFKDDDGCTPLHAAVKEENHSLMSYLLECGADPTVKDNSGKTPIGYLDERHDEHWNTLRKAFVDKERQALTDSLESTFNLPPQQRSQSSRQRL